MSPIRNFSLFRESETSTPEKGDKLSNLSKLGIVPPAWTWEEIKKAYEELIEEIEWEDIITFAFDYTGSQGFSKSAIWDEEVEINTYKNQITFEIRAKPMNLYLLIDISESAFFNLFEDKLDQIDSEALIGDKSWGFESIRNSFENSGWNKIVQNKLSEFQESEDCWINIISSHRDWNDGTCSVTFKCELDVNYEEVKDVMISSASDILDDVEYELKK